LQLSHSLLLKPFFTLTDNSLLRFDLNESGGVSVVFDKRVIHLDLEVSATLWAMRLLKGDVLVPGEITFQQPLLNFVLFRLRLFAIVKL
jgi:hypothetical protein